MYGGEVEFLKLTGHPRATRGSDEISFLPDKRFQLLTYLAYNSGWVGRERAAFLFWPDADTESSRRNLRGLLQRLRTLPFEPGIEANKHHLRWDVPTDVKAFNEAVEQGDFERAIDAYQGPLDEGLDTDDAGEFGEWLEIAREELRSRWRALALSRLAESEPGAERVADSLVRRLLDADPLDEEAVRTYLTAMIRLRRPAAGRGLYREFAARLEHELGLEPTSETVAAFEALRDLEAPPLGGPLSVAEEPVVVRPLEFRRFTHLPAPTTRFIGRDKELLEIVERLRDPDCRLLSLVGQGGIGKTRLALAAAIKLADASSHPFADGVLFLPLDVTQSPTEVLPTLADALDIRPIPGEDLFLRVAGALADAQVLLVFDNFEHVLGAAELVPRLLEAGAGVKVLVTTRERLGLSAEWVYPVEGLDYPVSAASLESLATFGAVQLLVDRAQRVKPGFKLTADDLPALERLWTLTQGLPLAIELTAAWLRSVPLPTLVDDISENLDLLTTATRDSITRHGSIRGIFEQSWSNLTASERLALNRLAVFRAPVSPEAATYVSAAARATIAALVDKSLLRLDRNGRYDQHPLLYSFTREKSAEEPTEREASEQRHSAYYLRFLRERTDRARGLKPAPVMREIATEMGEVRSAMRRAHDTGDGAQLVDFMQLLEMEIGYYQAHGHTDETLELLAAAASAAIDVDRLGAAHDLRGRLGDAYGIHRGDLARGLVEYRAAADLARRVGDTGREAVFVSLCGVMMSLLDSSSGWEELDQALALARSSTDGPSLSTVLEHRGYVLARAKDYGEALKCYRESLTTIEDSADRVSVDSHDLARRRYYATLNIGGMEHYLGRFDEALAARHEALRIAEEMGNPIWRAHAHLEIGEVYSDSGQHVEAKRHLEHAASLYSESHVTAQLARVQAIAAEHSYDLSEPDLT